MLAKQITETMQGAMEYLETQTKITIALEKNLRY
jgi:hypothetical protein